MQNTIQVFVMKMLLPLDIQFFADGEGASGTGEGEENTTPNTETQTSQQKENMIPKSRFDEVNAKYKEMAEKIATFEKAETDRKAAEEKAEIEAKKKQGEFEELYNGLQKELESYKAFEDRTKSLEGVINGMVESKLKEIPEEFHELIPSNLTTEQTLEWINKAESKGLFGKQEVKEIGKPSNQQVNDPKLNQEKMSPLDKILAGLGK